MEWFDIEKELLRLQGSVRDLIHPLNVKITPLDEEEKLLGIRLRACLYDIDHRLHDARNYLALIKEPERPEGY